MADENGLTVPVLMAPDCPEIRTNPRLCDLPVVVLISALLAATAFAANGQDLEPRNYANTPVGLNNSMNPTVVAFIKL